MKFFRHVLNMRLIRVITLRWKTAVLSYSCDRAWSERLSRNGDRLRDLNQSTETEFLSIGQALQGFHTQTEEIAQLSSRMSDLLLGKEISETTERVRSMHHRIQSLEDGSNQRTSHLRHVFETLNRAGSHLSGFDRIVRQLRTLCVSIKVENARFGGDIMSFDILAGDINKLAREIEEKCAGFQDRSVYLVNLLENTLGHVSELERTIDKQSAIILRRIMDNLVSLKEKHEHSSAAVRNITERYNAISSGIAEVIISIQFHDITRQQIEHAGQMLEKAADELRGAGSRRGKEPKELRGSLAMTADICEIQIAQLHQARDQFSEAVDKILSNLRQMVINLTDIDSETRAVSGSVGEKETPFLSEMEKGFSSLLEALVGHGKASREISEALKSVDETLGAMSKFAGDIEWIGIQIKLVALNAIIKAAQVGDEGASLAILAEGIHALSVETCRHTDSISEILRIISDEKSRNHSHEKETGDLDFAVEEMGSVIGVLREINSEVAGLQTKIEKESGLLSAGIDLALSEFTPHEKVKTIVGDIVSDVEKLVAGLRLLAPKSDRTGAELEELQAAYTMESERQIYQSIVTGNQPVQTERETRHSGEEGEPELGENVELF